MKKACSLDLWLVITGLIILCAVLLLFRQRVTDDHLILEDSSQNTSAINIMELQNYSGLDLTNLPNGAIRTFYEKYHLDKGDNLLQIYTLEQIFLLAGIQKLASSSYIFSSSDGAMVKVESKSEQHILLTLEKNNQDISLRLIIPEDKFSQRWLKKVTKIKYEANNY